MSFIVLQDLPSFGPYLEERLQVIAEYKKTHDLLDESLRPAQTRPAKQPKMDVPTVKVRTCCCSLLQLREVQP